MAGITLSKAIKVFSSVIGCSGSEDGRDSLIDTITESLEYMLLNGGGDILREWKVPVHNGKFTFPRDLETPLKFKFSPFPTIYHGIFNSSVYSYGSDAIPMNCFDYGAWNPQFEVKTNIVSTQYEPPQCGVRLVFTTRDARDVGKKVVVSGKQRGMEIASTHMGHKIAGEVLTIYAEDDTEKRYSAYTFDEITSVNKVLTCSYTMLSGIDKKGQFYFLSHIHPDDEIPRLRQASLVGCKGFYGDCIMHVIGRVASGIRYVRDEDVLPITSVEMLRLLAKRVKYDEAGEFDKVAAMEQRVQRLIKNQIAYQEVPGRNLAISRKGSAATISKV